MTALLPALITCASIGFNIVLWHKLKTTRRRYQRRSAQLMAQRHAARRRRLRDGVPSLN